jgi:hypothetical protein
MSSLKETGNLDGGTPTIVGGTDWDTLIGYFKGKPNQFNAIINSDTEYKFGRLWLRNQNDSASQNLRAGNVTGNYAITLPSYDANDEVLTCNAPQEVKGKIINFANNTIIGSGTGGGSGEGKWGLIQAPRSANDGTVSQGILSGHINMGATISRDVSPPPGGTMWKYESGTTTNTNAGVRWADPWIRRDFNPRLRVKYRVPVGPTGARFFVGFSTDTDITPTQNAIEDTQSGILVGYLSTDANYVVIRNSGTSASSSTPIVDDTVNTATVAKSTSLYRIIEIAFTNQGADCKVTISKFAATYPYGLTTEFTKNYTTNLPAITSPGTGGSVYMRPVFQIANKESVNHTVELYKMELYEDF